MKKMGWNLITIELGEYTLLLTMRLINIWPIQNEEDKIIMYPHHHSYIRDGSYMKELLPDVCSVAFVFECTAGWVG